MTDSLVELRNIIHTRAPQWSSRPLAEILTTLLNSYESRIKAIAEGTSPAQQKLLMDEVSAMGQMMVDAFPAVEGKPMVNALAFIIELAKGAEE